MRPTCLASIFEIAKRDKRIVFIGSDIGYNLIDDYRRELPDQFYLEGISEQNLVGVAAGMAKAKPERRVYVVIGDGECDEGSVWEAALYAAKHKLDNLTVLVDYNKMQASGNLDNVQPLLPLSRKWESFGWEVMPVDGHDLWSLRMGIMPRTDVFMPRVVICHTIKGKGVAAIENKPEWHHKSKITEAEIKALYDGLEAY